MQQKKGNERADVDDANEAEQGAVDNEDPVSQTAEGLRNTLVGNLLGEIELLRIGSEGRGRGNGARLHQCSAVAGGLLGGLGPLRFQSKGPERLLVNLAVGGGGEFVELVDLGRDGVVRLQLACVLENRFDVLF